MADVNIIDLDEMRRDFAVRFNQLIEAEEGEKKHEKFCQAAGISPRQASQWRNPRHINWPSVPNLITLAVKKDINPVWLLLGIGQQNLSTVKQNMSDHQHLSTLASLLLSVTPKSRRAFEEIATEVLGDADLFGQVAKIVRRRKR